MNRKETSESTRVLAAFLLFAFAGTLQSATIPLSLADPNGQPGHPAKPVKVYVLAGQSNMVGMGDITGAKPPYPSVYLSADPAVIPGRMPFGTSRSKSACQWIWRGVPALAKFGVYPSADKDATSGAIVDIHHGAYDPKADYSVLRPVKTMPCALGTIADRLPSSEGACTRVARAFIEVPESGTYLVHVGFGGSSHAIAKIAGQEVYRKEPGGKPTFAKILLESGRRHELRITFLEGGSAALWLEQTDLVGKGDLVTLTRKDGKFAYLIDDAGNWTTRMDVTYREARVLKTDKSGPLTATSNGGSIGPELGFGWIMGTYHDEQVLLIKTAMGNRALRYDFRPPSSGRNEPDSQWEGLEYRLMVKGVRETLEKIDQYIPGYKGQGYEIAGFCWFQGHKDSGSTKEEYEQCLVNLIKDLRKDLNAPGMKAVVATVGFRGYRLMSGPWKGVWEAQVAVGDAKQHPDFAGSVASVDTRDFWREVEESPRGQDYHYHRNPEFYLLTGEAMGRAMVRLLGGQAVEIPKSDREAKTMAAMAAEAAAPVPTAEQKAASIAAVKPMVLDGLLVNWLADAKIQSLLKTQLVQAQPKPAKTPEYLDDVIDDGVALMQAAGITECDWKPVVEGMKYSQWDYFGFNIPDSPYLVRSTAKASDEGEEGGEEVPLSKDKKASPPPIKITLPTGLEQWFAPDFDTKKAGWKSGRAPFGVKLEENVPEQLSWIAKYPLYPLKRNLPASFIENDVVLMRQTFELPPLQEGHRYRIRIEGSIHDNSGEGYAIYINGKLLAEVKNGVTAWRKQGLRGSPVWQEFLDDLKGGKVTIAVANFPMANYDPLHFIPAIGPLSVWIEGQKLPEFDLHP